MSKSKQLYLAFFCILLCATLWGNQIDSFSSQMDSLEQGPRDKATIPIIEEMLKISIELSRTEEQLKLLNWYGQIHLQMSNFDLALEKYIEQAEKARAYNLLKYETEALTSMGTALAGARRFEESHEKFNAALELAEKHGFQHEKAKIYGGISILFSRQQKYDEALSYNVKENEIYQKIGDKEDLVDNEFNRGFIYLSKGEPENALPFSLNFIQFAIENQNTLDMALGSMNTGVTYMQMEEFDKSLIYFEKVKEISAEHGYLNYLANSYYNIYRLYKKKGELKEALKFLKKTDSLDAEVLREEMATEIVNLEKEYDLHLQESKLFSAQKKLSEEKLKQQKIIILFSVLFFLFVSGAIFLFFRRANLIKKNKLSELNTEILQHKLAAKENENQQLANKLKFKESDVTNLAIDITRRNEFNGELVKKLQELCETKNTSIRKEVKSIILNAQYNLRNNEDNDLLQNNVETFNTEFFKKLEATVGDLTRNEKYMAGLIKLNLSNKEIANIRGISINSARVNRYRLKKKMNLDPDVDMVTYLNNV